MAIFGIILTFAFVVYLGFAFSMALRHKDNKQRVGHWMWVFCSQVWQLVSFSFVPVKIILCLVIYIFELAALIINFLGELVSEVHDTTIDWLNAIALFFLSRYYGKQFIAIHNKEDGTVEVGEVVKDEGEEQK